MTGARERARRGSERLVAVTDRDLDLLALVGRCGYASLEQVARELFPSADRARRRVRVLFDGRLLTLILIDSRRPNLVGLTRRGLRTLEVRRPDSGALSRLPGGIRLPGIDHHLATVDAWLYAAALGAKRSAALRRFSFAGGALGRELGLDALHLAPDGLAEFATDTGSVVVAIEVDCGTEASSVVDRKLARYAAPAADGRLDALWVVVAAGPGRHRALAELVDRHGLGAWARLIPHRHVTARPVAELPARAAAQEMGQRPEYGLHSGAPATEASSAFDGAGYPPPGGSTGGVDGGGRP